MTTWTKELDEASILATKKGYWHVVLFYLLCGLASIPTSFLVFSQVFTNATPEHWCASPPELQPLGLPQDLLRLLTVPQKGANGLHDGANGLQNGANSLHDGAKGHQDGANSLQDGAKMDYGLQNGTFESCLAYDVDPRALYAALSEYVDERSEVVREGGSLRLVQIKQLVAAQGEEERKEQISRVKEAILSVRSPTATKCSHGWQFSTEHYTRTLVTKFELVCDNDWWPRTSNTLFWVGSIFGNLFFGWMSDRYGRRPTILLMIYLEVPLAIAASFPPDYITHVALRVAGGLFFPALYQQPFILALELMPPLRRTYTGIVVGMLFASGMCLLAVLAYLLRDWFLLSLATSVPFVLLYSYYWLIPESPRWLVGRGRIAEAEKVFRNLAKKNNILLPYGFLLELHKKVKEEEDAETTMLSNVNGHISDYDTPRYIDRRLSNMLSFKPNRISEDERNKSQDIERIIALEVAEIVKKKREDSVEGKDEESHLNIEISTQTDPYKPTSLRRKSLQLVTRMFVKEDSSTDLENKRMDDQNSVGDCKASPLDVFRYPNIRKKFLLLTFEWIALGVVYNSLSYNTPNLGVDDYLAFFIGGAVEIPSYVIAWQCMDRFGRRWVLCIFMCIGGLACLSCVLVPEDLPWVTVTLAMLGRLCAAASFAVFYVLIGELLPTVLRAQAMGAASFIAGLGLLACPYIVYLAVYSRALPLIIMGILSIMCGVTSLYLPETLNQPLPQTLSDGEMFGRDFKILSCVDRPKK